jgi:hypothetical protein
MFSIALFFHAPTVQNRGKYKTQHSNSLKLFVYVDVEYGRSDYDMHLYCKCIITRSAYTHSNTTIPSTVQLFLFFPFHKMFWPQPAIRYLNLPNLLYCIQCQSFTSHVTLIFHDFKFCNHNLANISQITIHCNYLLLKFIKNVFLKFFL